MLQKAGGWCPRFCCCSSSTCSSSRTSNGIVLFCQRREKELDWSLQLSTSLHRRLTHGLHIRTVLRIIAGIFEVSNLSKLLTVHCIILGFIYVYPQSSSCTQRWCSSCSNLSTLHFSHEVMGPATKLRVSSIWIFILWLSDYGLLISPWQCSYKSVLLSSSPILFSSGSSYPVSGSNSPESTLLCIGSSRFPSSIRNTTTSV